jgi:hypothetical protein
MIIDTEALHLREEIGPELAANLLNDMKGIANTLAVRLGHAGDSERGTIGGALLTAFASMHEAEALIRQEIAKD